jgi:hypothetical protein
MCKEIWWNVNDGVPSSHVKRQGQECGEAELSPAIQNKLEKPSA